MVAGREIVDERVEIARPLFVRTVEHVRPIQRQRRDLRVNGREHRVELHASQLSFRGAGVYQRW